MQHEDPKEANEHITLAIFYEIVSRTNSCSFCPAKWAETVTHHFAIFDEIIVAIFGGTSGVGGRGFIGWLRLFLV
jgi:hypothetical protein